MNIELDEVVVQDVSDDALEMVAGSGGPLGQNLANPTTYLPHHDDNYKTRTFAAC